MENELIAPSEQIKLNKVEIPKKTYFYEKKDGSVIEAQANEAWTLHKKGFKQIGVSSGKKYEEAVKLAHQVFKQTLDKQKVREILLKGRNDELEEARGKFETPPNMDKMGPGRGFI